MRPWPERCGLEALRDSGELPPRQKPVNEARISHSRRTHGSSGAGHNLADIGAVPCSESAGGGFVQFFLQAGRHLILFVDPAEKRLARHFARLE